MQFQRAQTTLKTVLSEIGQPDLPTQKVSHPCDYSSLSSFLVSIFFLCVFLLLVLFPHPSCSPLCPHSPPHYGLRGGVRNFFNVWCEQTLISHLSGYPKPRSKECPLLGPLLGPPGPKIDQKRVQIAQKRPKSDFEGSGGPKRLERRGTKLERGTGHICWDFQTNWECGGDPNFGLGAPKKGPNGPKTVKI